MRSFRAKKFTKNTFRITFKIAFRFQHLLCLELKWFLIFILNIGFLILYFNYYNNSKSQMTEKIKSEHMLVITDKNVISRVTKTI